MVIITLLYVLLLCRLTATSNTLPHLQPGAAKASPILAQDEISSGFSAIVERTFPAGLGEQDASNHISPSLPNQSVSTAVVALPIIKRQRRSRVIQRCVGELDGWSYVKSFCSPWGQGNYDSRAYRILCVQPVSNPTSTLGGSAAKIGHVHGRCLPHEVCQSSSANPHAPAECVSVRDIVRIAQSGRNDGEISDEGSASSSSAWKPKKITKRRPGTFEEMFRSSSQKNPPKLTSRKSPSQSSMEMIVESEKEMIVKPKKKLPEISQKTKIPYLRDIDLCPERGHEWGFINSACHNTSKSRSYQAYRIMCSRFHKKLEHPSFIVITGHCAPHEICVDVTSGIRAQCVSKEYFVHQAGSALGAIKMAAEVDSISQKLATPHVDDEAGGILQKHASEIKRRGTDPHRVTKCNEFGAGWEVIWSECTDIRKYRFVCGRNSANGNLLVRHLVGECSPEEVCVSSRRELWTQAEGAHGSVSCVRLESVVRSARNGLEDALSSKPQGKIESGARLPATRRSIGAIREDISTTNIQSFRKREIWPGRYLNPCQADHSHGRVVVSGCDPANHRGYWMVCSEPAPVWDMPHQVFREGQCTDSEICVPRAQGGQSKPLKGMEGFRYPVATCVKLSDFATSPDMQAIHKASQVHRSAWQENLTSIRNYLSKRDKVSGRLITECAGEYAKWRLVLSGCHPTESRTYYTICAAPLPYWEIPYGPEQIRTSGQCLEGERCVNGRMGGPSSTPIPGLEHMYYFIARCVPLEESVAFISPANDIFVPLLPAVPLTPSPQARGPSRPAPSSAESMPRSLAKRKVRVKINRCSGEYGLWHFMQSSCRFSAGQSYYYVCSESLDFWDIPRQVSLDGVCPPETMCVNLRVKDKISHIPGFAGVFHTEAECVALADWVKNFNQGIRPPPSSLGQLPIPPASSVPTTSKAPPSSYWYPKFIPKPLKKRSGGERIMQCEGAHSHWIFNHSFCHGADATSYYVACSEPVPGGVWRPVVRTLSSCSQGRMCVDDPLPAPFSVRNRWYYTAAKCASLGEWVENFNKGLPNRSPSLASRSTSSASPARKNSSLAGRHISRRSSTHKMHFSLPEDDDLRTITKCTGDYIHWSVLMSGCTGNGNRYWVVCIEPAHTTIRTRRRIHQVAQCAEEETCVSHILPTPTEPPSDPEQFSLGKAKCVPEASVVRNARVTGKRLRDSYERLATRDDISDARNQTVKPTLQKRRGTKSHMINRCPGSYGNWAMLASSCVHPRLGVQGYSMLCSEPRGRGLKYFASKCSDKQICVTGHDDPKRVRARCIQKNELPWSVDLVSLLRRTSKKTAQRRSLERRDEGRPINQCPGVFASFQTLTSACKSDSDHRKFWMYCALGGSVPIMLSGECQPSEICVSNYRGAVPQYPIHGYEYYDFGIARCVSHDTFVRTAYTITRTRNKGKDPDGDTPSGGATTGQSLPPANAKLQTRQAMLRPIDACTGRFRNWSFISSSCIRSQGDQRLYRIWCTCDPNVGSSDHVHIKARCSPDEVCVPDAHGTSDKSRSTGSRYLPAKMAACFSREKIVRIAEVALGRTAGTYKGAAATGEKGVHEGTEPSDAKGASPSE